MWIKKIVKKFKERNYACVWSREFRKGWYTCCKDRMIKDEEIHHMLFLEIKYCPFCGKLITTVSCG